MALLLLDQHEAFPLFGVVVELALPIGLLFLLSEAILFELLGTLLLSGFLDLLETFGGLLLEPQSFSLFFLLPLDLILLEHLLAQTKLLFVPLRLQSLGLLEFALVQLCEIGLLLELLGLFLTSNALLFLFDGLATRSLFSLILGPIGLVHGSKRSLTLLFLLFGLSLGVLLFLEHLDARKLILAHALKLLFLLHKPESLLLVGFFTPGLLFRSIGLESCFLSLLELLAALSSHSFLLEALLLDLKFEQVFLFFLLAQDNPSCIVHL